MGLAYNLRKAVFEALDGNVTDANAAAVQVVDKRPQSVNPSSAASYPAIVFGVTVAGEWDTDTTNGRDVTMRLHTYSDTGSKKETEDMQDAIYGLLHHQGLTVTGQTTVLCYRETSDINFLEDGICHGIDEYRILGTAA